MFKNKQLVTLFFTMVVMMLGFGIIIPIMPFYMEHFGAGGTQLGMLMAVFSLMQFVFSPFWGSMSDRYGRKKIMMIGVIGNALSLLVIGFAQSMWMIFAARAIEGMISAATFPTAMAYISDSTTDEERGGGMGVIGAAMGIGMVLGPGMGGWLSVHSLSTPFFLAASMSFLSLGMIWFVLPESLPKEKRIYSSNKFRGPQLSMLWKALFGPLGFVLVLAFLVNFALANFEGIFGLFADKAYHYGPTQVGSVMVVVGIISSLVQMLLTGPATRRLGERNVIKLSLVASAVGFLLMAASPNNILVPVTVGIFVFSNAMLRPSISSLTSKYAKGGQGMALGLNNSFQSLGRVIGPLWAGSLFDFHITLPYLSAAVIMMAAFAYSLYAMRSEAVHAENSSAPLPTPIGPE
jgi:DHA1 family multidrug resistance protein-like MFS transporter